MKHLRKWVNIMTIIIMVIMSIIPAHVTNASPQEITTLGDTATETWPTFIPYTLSNGTPILDEANEPGISPDDIDITSGVDKGMGNLPSVYVASDSTNIFFRLRVKGDPSDRKGGFTSSVWSVHLAVDRIHKATIGINGKSPQVDYVYIANANGTTVQPIYKTDGTGKAVPGTSVTRAENGHYFLDFQVPIARINQVDNGIGIDSTTPIQLFFGTSKAANLSVINKDGMDASDEPSFTNKVTVKLGNLTSHPSIVINGGASKEYETTNMTMTGTFSAPIGSTVSVKLGDGSYNSAVVNGSTWSFTLPALQGNVTATAKVTDPYGNSATASQEVIKVASSGYKIEILSGSTVVTHTTSHTAQVKVMATNGDKLKLYLNGNTTPIITDNLNNITSDPRPYSITSLLPGSNTLKAAVEKGNNATTAESTATQYIILSTLPNISISSITGGSKPTISGTTNVANGKVEVMIDGVLKGIVTVVNGNWSLKIERPLSADTYSVSAKVTDSNVSTATDSEDYIVDESDISISIDNGTSLNPNENEPDLIINDNLPTIRGRTNAGDTSEIKVYIKQNSVVKQTLDNIYPVNGVWKADVNEELLDGNYTVLATVGSASATQILGIDTDTTVSITSPEDLSTISETNPTIQGEAESYATIDLKINIGTTVLVKKIDADENGDWSYQQSLSEGVYNLNVTSTDLYGNERLATSSFKITSGPVITNVSPANNAMGVAVGANLVVTFSKNVTAVTDKNIVIYDASDNTPVATMDAADSQVSVSNNQVTIDPTFDLASNKSYYVQIEAGSFNDGSDNPFDGISDTTTWRFTTATGVTPNAYATADADSTSPVVGENNEITLIVKKSDGTTDTDFEGARDVTISGVEQAPNGSYGSFNGTTLNGAGETVSVTFTDGIATVNLVLNKADEQTIVFNIAGVTNPATNNVAITPVAGAVDSLTETIAPVAGVRVGTTAVAFTANPQVTLKDAYGNVAAGTLVASVSDNGASWILGGTTSQAAVNGVVTYHDLTAAATSDADVNGAKIRYTVGGVTLDSTAFNLTAGVTPNAYATAAADTVSPVVGENNEITLTVKKSDGTTDTDFEGARDVTISGVEQAPNGSYGSFDGTTLSGASETVSVTFTDGIATANLVLNKADEQKIGFGIAGVTNPATNNVTIPPVAGAVDSLTETIAPVAGVRVGTTAVAFTTNPQVTLKDAYGNVAAGTVVASVSDNGAPWTLGGTTSIAAVNGVVAYHDLTVAATSEADVSGAKIRYTVGGVTLDSTAFNLTAGVTPNANATAAADTVSPVVGENNEITLTVKKSDGTTDTDFEGARDVTISGVEQAPNGSYGTFNRTTLSGASETVSVTFTDGIATVNLVLNKADEQTIGFSIAGVTNPDTNEVTITPVAGAVASLTETIAPVGGVRLGTTAVAFTTNPKVTLKDAYGNLAAGTVVASVSDNGVSWTLGGATSQAAVNGVVTYHDLTAAATSDADVSGAKIGYTVGGVTLDSTAFNMTATPTILNATTNTAGTTITLSFSKAMADPAGKHNQFSFKINGGAPRSFSSATLAVGDPTKIVLTISGSAIENGNTVTVDYTAGTIVGSDSSVIASFTNQPVTNTVPAPPSPSGSSSSSSSTPAPKVDELTVKVDTGTSGAGKDISTATIKRTTLPDGSKNDQVEFSQERAQETVTKLVEEGQKTARIVIPDEKDEVSELNVKIPSQAVQTVANGNVDLEVFTHNARISVPNGSLRDLPDDLYFRVVPIKDETKRQQIEEQVKREQLTLEVAQGKKINLVERPSTIETNMKSRPVTLVLPLRQSQLPEDKQEREEYLKNMFVFIEHSDGEKVIRKGELVDYDETGLLGYQFGITKFSTFSIVHLSTEILDYRIKEQTQPAQIDFINGTIKIEVAKETDLRYLVPEFTLSSGADATLDGITQKSGESVVDFTKPVTYVIHGSDGMNKLWTVEVTLAGNGDSLRKGFHTPYITGYRDGTFKPANPITRAEMAAIFAKVAIESSGLGSDYPDSASHWAKEAIKYVSGEGIMKGYTDGRFYPQSPITRAEMAAIVYQWKKLKKSSSSGVLSDVKGHWAEDIILAVEQDGIMKGYEDGTFKPNQSLARTEAVTILNRLFKRGPLHGVQKSTWPDVSMDHWAFHEIEEASRIHSYESKEEGQEFYLEK